ncbi:MAG: glycosyltransferase family 1 protein, partial [Phormidesmis sp. CAN_BIN44]|nr:glycosyltransferase family 1 protein [Phormidesmis sp. CAN_BIN44]
PQDIGAFADAIDRILRNDLWATKLKLRASERVQRNFSWSGVAAQLSDLYRRVLAQSITNELLAPGQLGDLSGAIVVPTKALTQVS